MGSESFSDLDDAAILSELLAVLSLAAPRVGLEVNWMKTKIQSFDTVTSHLPTFMIGTHKVDLVTSFLYLGVTINNELGP